MVTLGIWGVSSSESLHNPFDLISGAFYLNEVNSRRLRREGDLLFSFFDAMR